MTSKTLFNILGTIETSKIYKLVTVPPFPIERIISVKFDAKSLSLIIKNSEQRCLLAFQHIIKKTMWKMTL